ncbi:hypothetical protein PENSPDRAFT_665344 [Peniophora sp. CONT]|nr:hypothetical protein PENSPDRAFT_665344 [Peniophora sp. CONT]
MNIDAGLPHPIPLHIFVHTVNPSLQGELERGGRQPREGSRMRDVARRIMNALPGSRTQSRATQSPTSEPSTPSSQGSGNRRTLPILQHPILTNVILQPPPPAPMQDHHQPPAWTHNESSPHLPAPPQMQGPPPQMYPPDGELAPPMQPPVVHLPFINPEYGASAHYNQYQQQPIDQRIARGAEYMHAAQPIQTDQPLYHPNGLVSEPWPVDETGRESAHAGEHAGRSISTLGTLLAESRPRVPERSSTIYSFPTVSTGFTPKRHSVESRRSSYYPPMSSRFSTNTSVLDGNRSRSHSLQDEPSLPATDGVLASGGIQRRRRESRSNLRVSFSSQPSREAPSTDTDNIRQPSPSLSSSSEHSAHPPFPAAVFDGETETVPYDDRNRRKLVKILGIPVEHAVSEQELLAHALHRIQQLERGMGRLASEKERLEEVAHKFMKMKEEVQEALLRHDTNDS